MTDKLCMGTVQLGLAYGINNAIKRRPSDQESFALLKLAIEKGIHYFDTASVYGDAESILGNFEIGKYNVKIISKLRAEFDINNIETAILREITQSITRMGIKKLDGYLLHEASMFYNADIMRGLQGAKDKGLVNKLGVSVYDPEDALNVVKSGLVEYIQIPYNVFDQQLDQTDFFEIADKKNIVVFARSAFLQGLLMMDPEKIADRLVEAREPLQRFNDIINQYGYTRQEAAFLFSYCHKGIDKVVFGVETRQQLENNLAIIEKAKGFASCKASLEGSFREIGKRVINPSLWNQL